MQATPEAHVSHTAQEKAKLLINARGIRRQIEAIERALEETNGRTDVLHLIAAARGAINGLMAEIITDHIRLHVIDPAHESDAERAHAAEELIDVTRSYLK
jgi:FrmR/RcnR family transcriptional regulator, repressor of frmRAB operon